MFLLYINCLFLKKKHVGVREEREDAKARLRKRQKAKGRARRDRRRWRVQNNFSTGQLQLPSHPPSRQDRAASISHCVPCLPLQTSLCAQSNHSAVEPAADSPATRGGSVTFQQALNPLNAVPQKKMLQKREKAPTCLLATSPERYRFAYRSIISFPGGNCVSSVGEHAMNRSLTV